MATSGTIESILRFGPNGEKKYLHGERMFRNNQIPSDGSRLV